MQVNLKISIVQIIVTFEKVLDLNLTHSCCFLCIYSVVLSMPSIESRYKDGTSIFKFCTLFLYLMSQNSVLINSILYTNCIVYLAEILNMLFPYQFTGYKYDNMNLIYVQIFHVYPWVFLSLAALCISIYYSTCTLLAHIFILRAGVINGSGEVLLSWASLKELT